MYPDPSEALRGFIRSAVGKTRRSSGRVFRVAGPVVDVRVGSRLIRGCLSDGTLSAGDRVIVTYEGVQPVARK